MSERNIVQLLRSDIEGATPSSNSIEYGEIALNYFYGDEGIFIKNTSNEIVAFKPKSYVDNLIVDVKNTLETKQDIIDDLTVNTTNTTSALDLEANSIIVFNVTQTFTSKIFNIKVPENTSKEYTWTLRFLLGDTVPAITFNAPSNYTLRWANNTAPTYTVNTAYEITFKYIPGVNLILGVWGGF